MNDSIKHKILLLISHSGSITELIKDGYTYGQIANFINELSEFKFIEDKDGNLGLTELAQNWLKAQKQKSRKSGVDQWILPEKKSTIRKLEKDEVYLPSRNELHF